MSAAFRRRRLPALAKFVIETMRDGHARQDREGRLLGWNPGARAITGWPAAEAEQRFPSGLPLGDTVVELAGRRVELRRFDSSDQGEDWIVTLFSPNEPADAPIGTTVEETLAATVAELDQQVAALRRDNRALAELAGLLPSPECVGNAVGFPTGYPQLGHEPSRPVPA